MFPHSYFPNSYFNNSYFPGSFPVIGPGSKNMPNQVQAQSWKVPRNASNTSSLAKTKGPTPHTRSAGFSHDNPMPAVNSNVYLLREVLDVPFSSSPHLYRPSYLNRGPRNPKPLPNGGVSPPAVTVAVVQAGVTAANEVQLITINNASGGTFTLTFGAQTTAAQAFNVSASSLQTALRGLSSIGAGNVNVTGSNGGPFTVTFVSALASAPQSLITADGGSLTGATPTINVTEQTAGLAPVNAQQTLTFVGSTGNIRLAVLSGFTTVINLASSTAASVQAAIAAAYGVGPGNVTVTGANGGPYTITFAGALAALPIAKMQPVRD